jgi:ketosteroid isomerase-like protein
MSASDVIEIEQVLYRYCFAVDMGTPDEVAALFAEDAVLKPVYTGGEAVTGRAAIREWYVNYQKNTRGATTHLRHTVTNPVIDVTGETASARCYLTADSLSKASGKASWSAGYYLDRLVKRGGAWQFAERQIHVNYATQSEPIRR